MYHQSTFFQLCYNFHILTPDPLVKWLDTGKLKWPMEFQKDTENM